MASRKTRKKAATGQWENRNRKVFRHSATRLVVGGRAVALVLNQRLEL